MSSQLQEKKKTKQSVLRPPILKAMKESMKNRTRRRFALALAGIVVFTTTYSLILPALTLESNTASRMAGWKPASAQAELLNCQLDIHQHTDDCYKMIDGKRTLTCGQADYVLHTHDENCYDADGNLVCTLPEITGAGKAEKTGSAVISESAEADTANDVKAAENEADRTLEPHIHTMDCYEKGPNGESPEEMGWVKVNEDGSITGDPEHLICGRLEVKEHQHTTDCFTQAEPKSNADANVSGNGKNEKEKSSDNGKKESGQAALTDSAGDGHKSDSVNESAENKDAGKADISTDSEETDRNTEAADKHNANQNDQTAGKEATKENNKTADKADQKSGLSDTASASVKEGRDPSTDAKQQGVIDRNYEGDGYRIHVIGGADTGLPADTALEVREIGRGALDYYAYSTLAKKELETKEIGTLSGRYFDISFISNGKEIEPKAPVTVEISFEQPQKIHGDQNLQIIHFGQDQTGILANDPVISSEGVEKVSFESDSFSVFGVVYTVDFHWEVDGKKYDFSIPGGGFVSLEHLVEVLGIGAGDTNIENEDDKTDTSAENGSEIAGSDADKASNNKGEVQETSAAYDEAIKLNEIEVSEATKRFVADVKSIEFSSPELVWVGKVEGKASVGDLKKANGLEVEYSADLTEEQIAELNAQTAEAGDWALISMKPFISSETLKVTMKNGDTFTIQVTDAQISTQYLRTNGNLYEVTVIYGEDAKIPEGASLQVTEYDKKTEEYQSVRKTVLGDEQTSFSEEEKDNITEAEGLSAGEEAAKSEKGEGKDDIPADSTYREKNLEALDISILNQSGEPIEPEAPVVVRIVMKKLPTDKELFEETAAVQHLNISSGKVQIETVADTDNIGGIYVSENTATADFTLGSFSQFAITYYRYNNTTSSRVTVNVHYVDIDGKELNGTTNNVTANWNQSITLSTYKNTMTQSGYTYLGAHYGTYSGQVITSLQGTTSSSGSLSNSNYIVEFKNGNNIVARQEYEGSQRQIDVYLVFAPASGYYIQDTIGEDGCLTVYNGTEVVQTGIDQNLFVRWYRSDNGTGGFQEVTQSKILDGNYNVPELGGPKVNVAIDEGADKYYKADIYKVENNEEVKLAETAVYHVPYYDDVRNGGFETPHNDTKNGSGRYWPSNYQIENGKEGVVWKTTGVGTGDKAGQDIEIPQGAAADGTGANDLGETLRNYCFAFMPEGNQCAELNCEASGALYQDVLTIPGSQIYWSLYHRARGGYDKWKTETDKTQNKETDTMYVVAMSKELAEKYDVTTQAKVLSILNHVNDPDSEFHDVEIIRITTTNQGNGTMEFLNSNYTMTVPPTWFGNLANGQTASVKDSGTNLTFMYGNTDWHYYTGNFSIPKDQYLTRFFFVAGNTASGNPTMGNFLDDICLSDSVPSPNYGQATAIVQKTVKGLDALPENYATRIETTYEVKSYSGITSSTDRNSDYDLYRTQIDEDGKAVSTASWTFPITIGSGGSAAFTNGKEVSPLAEGKTDEIDGYEQTTTWTISKRNTNGEELTVIASGTGKVIPDGELAKLMITEKDVVCIEFINFYQKKQPVSVWKTDLNSRTITTGAAFDLYKAEDFDDSTNMHKEGAVKVATGTTGTNGILYLGELSKGEYRLLETKAPDGYNLPDAAIKITVSDDKVTAMQGSDYSEAVTKENEKWVEGQNEDTKQIQVWNNPGVELPSTGGPGTNLIYLFGIMLTGLAGAGLVMRRRRRNAA